MSEEKSLKELIPDEDQRKEALKIATAQAIEFDQRIRKYMGTVYAFRPDNITQEKLYEMIRLRASGWGKQFEDQGYSPMEWFDSIDALELLKILLKKM